MSPIGLSLQGQENEGQGQIRAVLWRCSDLPRGNLSLETSVKAEGGEREAETLASTLHAASGSY